MASTLQRIPSESSSTFLDLSQPLVQKERILIICRVENDGEIKENKPIYIPRLHWQKDLKLSVLGPNDVKVLHNSIQQGVNMIAVSCVESKDDLTYVKKILGSKGQQIKVLAKLQSQRALENFDQILEASDGIIIARGYLGLSLDLEDVVYVQKYIIKKCNTHGKPVLISTQILESMVTKLIPSRSEVVDISNAVYDGVDSLILSPETASGVFYEQATDTMSQICLEAERHINYLKRYHDQQRLLRMHLYQATLDKSADLSLQWSTEDTISSCAVKASFDVKASLIIVFTYSGITARKVAKHKPKCPVMAVTPNEWAAKSMLLHRGVYSMVVGSLIGSDTLITKVLEHCGKSGFIVQGDYVVITSGLSGTVGSTNLLKIIKV
ncbi:hypothetical protein FGO68_gene8788 [Halteria grandinella]|nr:hypothetical protein FGO68_gene8788 [Halteria grandinella]